MLFGAMEAVKKDLAEYNRRESYKAVRLLYKEAVPLSDDDLRVIYQALDQRNISGGIEYYWALCLDTSMIGQSLLRNGMVYVHNDCLRLTKVGELIHQSLARHIDGKKATKNLPAVVPQLSPLQSFVKNIRENWEAHPRLNRFVIAHWRYRLRLWWQGTTPDLPPLVDFSQFQEVLWTDADDERQATLWRESGLLAFWLCPDGLDAGVAAHDKFLALCEERGLTGDARVSVVNEITGYVPPPPPPALPKPDKTRGYVTFKNTMSTTSNTVYLTDYSDLFKTEKEATAKLRAEKEAQLAKRRATAHMKRRHEEQERELELAKQRAKDEIAEKQRTMLANRATRNKEYKMSRERFKTEYEVNKTRQKLDALDQILDELTALDEKRNPKKKPRLSACGCEEMPYFLDKSRYVQCPSCGASWIPASRNIREVAQDEPNSFTRPPAKLYHFEDPDSLYNPNWTEDEFGRWMDLD